MNLFTYYRIAFVLSFIILMAGSVFKVTHMEVGFLNGNHLITAGLLSSVFYIALAYFMIFKSKKMPAGEKLIWVICFALGFIVNVGFISFATALVFFFVGPKRLFFSNKENI
ncbi:hypothetical protein [Paenimyroides aestuarii]|uniref:Uncharacterized protein n=1 Tax=Paenimyroides aestuarii TaxID=2968490 RepID=A0ABY5NUA9_9FLAO|nr:hypothetical protein [Paenimyroides aestuarii]UUV22175.1 hypothetical protein NPX36_03825 [Paenimyroides aestuarii]